MTERATAAPVVETDTDRVFDLIDDFTQAILVDPSLLDDVPHGATLVLLPDDDPEFVERSIQRGVEAIRHGRDVYFRHHAAAARDTRPGI
jgi:hypothetical protein